MFQKVIRARWIGIFYLLVLLTLISSASVKAATLYGETTDNQLARFDSKAPSSAPTFSGLADSVAEPTRQLNALDFDGDSRADYVNYRIFISTLFISRSSANNTTFLGLQFGIGGSDIFQPGDYDGDSRADIAVFRPSSGTWFILQSSNNMFRAVQFGASTDQPVAQDYDGDRRTDLAVVRRSEGAMIWYVLRSSNNSFFGLQFGFSSDRVAPGDYDGDGKTDIAVKRGAPGEPATFFIQQSTGGFRSVQFGMGEDLVVPGDYDGDDKTDVAVVRPGSQLVWNIIRSSDNSVSVVRFGSKGQFTVQADYNGDGRTDIATFEPGRGLYFILQSPNQTFIAQQFGTSEDYPVGNYNTY